MKHIGILAPLAFVAVLGALVYSNIARPNDVLVASAKIEEAVPIVAQQGMFSIPWSNAKPWIMYLFRRGDKIIFAANATYSNSTSEFNVSSKCSWDLRPRSLREDGFVVYDAFNQGNGFQRFMNGKCDAGFDQVAIKLSGNRIDVVLHRGGRPGGRGTLYR